MKNLKLKKYQKPYAEMIGADGNAFNLVGIGRDVARSLGLSEKDEVSFNITEYAKSYSDKSPSTLSLLMDYFDIVQVGFKREQEEDWNTLPENDEILAQMGNSPLHLLVSRNRRTEDYKRTTDGTAELEDHLNNINDDNCYHRTPLFYAQSASDVEFLIKNGADIWHTDMHNNLAIHVINNAEAKKAFLKCVDPQYYGDLFTHNNIFEQNWVQYSVNHYTYHNQAKETLNLFLGLKTIFDNPIERDILLKSMQSSILNTSKSTDKKHQDSKNKIIDLNIMDKEELLKQFKNDDDKINVKNFIEFAIPALQILNPNIKIEDITNSITKILSNTGTVIKGLQEKIETIYLSKNLQEITKENKKLLKL